MGTSGLLLDGDTHFKMIFALLLLQLVFVFNAQGKGKHFLIEAKDDVVKDDVVKDDATHFNEEEVDDVLDALPDEEKETYFKANGTAQEKMQKKIVSKYGHGLEKIKEGAKDGSVKKLIGDYTFHSPLEAYGGWDYRGGFNR